MRIELSPLLDDVSAKRTDECRNKRGEFLLKLNAEGFPFSRNIKADLSAYNNILNGVQNFDTAVVLGIGGSSLGTKMIYNAFPEYARKRLVFLETTEPERMSEVVKSIDYKKTLFIGISKSGSTMETAAAILFFIKEAKNTLGEDWKKHFLMITDPEKGDLRKFVQSEGLAALTVPSELGGRYSVLSDVGMFPLYFAGFPVDEITAGATDFLEECKKAGQQDLFRFAAADHAEYLSGKNILVLFPYAYRLKTFGEWFIQLWAESLGKKSPGGKAFGQTPLIAVGPTDQHSIIQLFTEGPNDKVILFINIGKRDENFTIGEKSALSSFSYLYEKNFTQLLNVELEGTKRNLDELKVPTALLTIPKLDFFNAGRLIMFSYILTVFTSYLYEVDPFDQPGVEGGKKIMYRLLKREGY